MHHETYPDIAQHLVLRCSLRNHQLYPTNENGRQCGERMAWDWTRL